ncbi:FAD dependent oxidoreductase [Aeromicrobium marinum DSM 15272]|uniref:FAD dependent oxidoreductase n=1 Tax=Aeromicrobium marinum DSM 15272 TaxID=585531 RepID=E2S8C5_9ACTN|nr:FAD-dependent oxidoreductase [Aeromicrobium marinum]EFQ84430.1 FAD dependent oxidoreductase [Aeromicrobium marinum DSM 15272]
MTQRPGHVVVVGAGMVGLATAWYLQRDGVEVTVVDRQGVAAGSSWGNAGWLAPALTLPLPDPAILGAGIKATLSSSSPVYVPPTANPRLLKWLADFTRHCTPGRWRSAMAVFAQANRLAFDAFDQMQIAEPTKAASPFLAAFTSESDRRVLVHEFEQVGDLGGEVAYDLLDAAQIHALEPALGEAVTCGARLHDQRFIDPGRYVRALGEAVVERGGRLVVGDVVGVERVGAGVEVRVGRDRLVADAAVVATGTWLGSLVRPHGVRSVVQAGRGYSFTVRPEHQPVGPIYFPAQRVACTPLGPPGAEDAFRVAGMMEFRKPDAPLDRRRVDAIVAAARPMLRGVDWEARTDEWVGSRPCTVDGLPLVGATRTPGVFVAGGHGMWGIALGPLSGRLLADRIVRGQAHPLLQSFDPLR